MLGRLGLDLGWNVDPYIGIAIGALFASLLFHFLRRATLHYNSVPEMAAVAPGGELPDCMVVIPARNEEEVIARAVKSLPPDTVIVVDDDSTDATPEEASQAGAGVLHPPRLPKGAIGKAHACMVGAAPLTSAWILFTDADTWFEPGFLDAAIAMAESEDLHFTSIYLKQEPQSVIENLVAPYVSALYFSAVDPRGNLPAAFNGQCILAKRGPYQFVGGHGTVEKRLVEDYWLAMAAVRHQMRIGIVRAGALGHARPHRGWHALRYGYARNASRLNLLDKGVGLRIALTGLIAMLWLPVAWLLLTAGQPWVAAAIPLLVVVLLRPWYRGWGWALLSPLAIYVAVPVLAKAMITTLFSSQIVWKGREI